MPIYAYKCASCGHAKDVLRKISDAPLTQCPACGAESFEKQVTAAGFQLKGSGWYATDFKGGNKPAPAAEKAEGGEPSKATEGKTADGKTAEGKTADAKPADGGAKPAESPAAPAKPKTDAPATSGGGGSSSST